MSNSGKLYDDSSLKVMRAAESASGFGANRIEQIRSFALSMNIKRIGIAHCIMFSTEAEIIQEYLRRDFDVFTVDCKYDRLKKGDLWGGSSSQVLCNPAGQAEYLNKNNTELNLSIGLCVGHDMIFNKDSKALVTSLFTKDFTNNHSPSVAIENIKRKL